MAGASQGHAHRLVLAALCAVTLFVGLGRPAITDTDEGFYAEAGREMIETGDWVTPHFNYTPRFEKPVFFYWLVASAYATTGVTETGARFFAALSGLGLVLIAYGVSRRWQGDGAALIAGAIVASSFGTFWMARQSLPDLPLAFFITLAIWAAVEAMSRTLLTRPTGENVPTPRERTNWLLLSAAALGAAALTKGPVGIVIPALVVGPLVAWEWWRGPRTGLPFTVRDVLLAGLIVVAIAAPWNLLMASRHPGYLSHFLYGENVERFMSPTKYNGPRTYFFFVPILLGGLVPWSAFFLLWLDSLRKFVTGRHRLGGVDLRLALWAAMPFLFYSAGAGKQPRYILPCLVPMAILLARSIHSRVTAPRTTPDPLLAGAGTLAGLFLAGIGAAILRAAPLFEKAAPGWSTAWPLLMVVAGGIVVVAALGGVRARLPLLVAAASAVALVGLHRSVLALGRPEPVERIAAKVREQAPGATLCQCGAFGRNLSFYTHSRIVGAAEVDEIASVLSAPGRVLAVVDEQRLLLVEQRLNRTFTRLEHVWYLETNALRLSMLSDPNPDRDLQHVILVSNQ